MLPPTPVNFPLPPMKNGALELLKGQDTWSNQPTTPYSSPSPNRIEAAGPHVAEASSIEGSNQLQGDFLNTVSRELQIPLCNMKMAIEVLTLVLDHNPNGWDLSPQAGSEETKVARCLKILRNECERQMNLINDLVDLQRLKAGVYPTFFTEVICLQEWLLPILAPLVDQAKHHQQTLEIQLASELPPLITEPTSLKRILTELLTTAHKYTPAGGTIGLEVYRNQDRLAFSLSNTGLEIPPDELPHVFDEFSYIPSTDPRRQSGLNLGLALVKKLVERLNGSIQVESAPNLTRFRVELPFVTRHLPDAPADRAADSSESLPDAAMS